MKKTALHDTHVKLGGRIVDFAGWALPVQYASMITEHKAVREDAGVFDCSHMGQFFIKGPEAYDFVQYMITNNLDKVGPGRGLYSGLWSAWISEGAVTTPEVTFELPASTTFNLIQTQGKCR